MKSIPYSSLLEEACDLQGWDSANLNSPQFHSAKRAISRGLETIWNAGFWPDLTRTEQRFFQKDYSSSTTYAAGEFVWHPPSGKYYQCLTEAFAQAPATGSGGSWATNLDYWAEAATSIDEEPYDASVQYVQGSRVYYEAGNSWHQAHSVPPVGTAPTDTDFWGEVTEMQPRIPWTMTGMNPIGRVRGVYDDDPRRFKGADEIEWWETHEGIAIPNRVGAWVRFLKRAPTLTGDVWDATATYTPADEEDSVTTETVVVTTNYSVFLEWVLGENYFWLTSVPDDDNVPVSGTIQWPDGSGGTWTRTHKSDTWRRYTGFVVTHSASGGTATQGEMTLDDRGNVIAAPMPVITGFAQTANQTLALNRGRYETLAAFRAATVLSDVVVIVADDQGQSGVFWLDENDNTTADDGVNCIVDAAGKRFKRA